MRIGRLIVVALALPLLAQLPIESIQLRGNRFKGLSYAEMTPAQRAMLDHTVNSARAVTNTTGNGPFNVLLRSPLSGDVSQRLGNQTRFASGLSGKLRELATLMAGRAWSSRYEWYAHARYAKDEGIAPEVIAAIAQNQPPPPDKMDAEERIVWRVSDELLYTRRLSQAAFDEAIRTLGEKRLVSVATIAAYYEYISMILNLDGYPLPADAPPQATSELAPLKTSDLRRKAIVPSTKGFGQIDSASLTEAQRNIPATSKAAGNYQALLRNPELGSAILDLGNASIANDDSHNGLQAGLARMVKEMWSGEPSAPTRTPTGEMAWALLHSREVSDAMFEAARAEVGEKGLADALIHLGYANITCATAALDGKVCLFPR
jgi:4-carboxymuconolactone decarboxylase